MLRSDHRLSLFDDAQIDLLRDAIGAEDLNAMLAEFPPAAAISLAAIEVALASDDFDQARQSAHVLKGCASTFGAARVAEAAREIELECKSIESIRRRLPVLIEALDQTATALSGVAYGGSGQ
jgi:HPt (histidine-containing phosphotransfer) domain-containing protein